MASLGNLWFDLGLSDKTDEDLDKIIKKLQKKSISLDVDIDKDNLNKILDEGIKESGKLNEGFDNLAKSLGISTEQAKSLVNAMNDQDASQMAILTNTEKVLRAKEKLLELERSINLRGLEGTKNGRETLAWIKDTKETIESIDVSDKMAVVKGTGAELSAQINIRKDLMRVTAQQVSREEKGVRKISVNNDKIERSLLRIQKIRDRIKDDPYREKIGYVGVNAELDKMSNKLKSMRGSNNGETRKYLSTGLSKEVQEVESLIKRQDLLFRNTNKQVPHMSRLWSQMGSQVKSVLSVYAAQRFVRQLIEMGGEFEKQKFALRAIIGDLGKADQIYNNLKKVAVKSPFHFGDFTSYAKQLAAFSIPVNEIYDTTKRLADVSAGLGVDMSRIILAYGQIRAASFLRGQEVRQLTEAGIPIIEELSKKLSELKGQVVTTGDVFDSISRREVPFAMIKDVFTELTDEGGKFNNMQEVLAQSLSGKWSNLTSHYQIMLDKMAQDSRGFLNGLIEGLTWAVVNIDFVTSSLWGLASGFATLKVMKAYKEFEKLASAALRAGKTVESVIRGLATTPNAIAAGVTVLTTAFIYARKKANEYEEKITDIISVSFELEEKVVSQMNALKDLANTEDKNIDVSVERHKIITKLAETEPRLAKEIKEHADNLEFLTKKTEEYVIASRAARDVELGLEGTSWVSDDIEGIEGSLDKAESKLGKEVLRLRREYSKELYRLGDDVYGSLANKYGEDSAKIISSIIDDVSLKGEEKYVAIYEHLYSVADEKGSVLEADFFRRRLSKYKSALSDVKEATEQFDSWLITAKGDLVSSIPSTYEQGTKEFNDIVTYSISLMQGLSDRVKKGLYDLTDTKPIDDSVVILDGWRAKIKEVLGEVIQITEETSLDDVMNDVSTAIDNTKKSLERLNVERLRERALTGDAVAKAQVEQYNKEKEDLDKLLKAEKLLGLIRKDNSRTSSKDPLADKMRERLDILKKANDEYEKYIPLLGKEEAIAKVLANIKYSNVGYTPDGFLKSIQDIYDKLGGTDAQKKLKENIEDMFSNVDFNKVKKDVDLLTKDIASYIEDNKERWDLFNKLFESTGDKERSFELAFGTTDDQGSFINALETKLEELIGEGKGLSDILSLSESELEENYGKPVIDLINKIKDEKDKANKEILLSDAKAIAESFGLEEKANAIRSKYQREIEKTDSELAKESYAEQMNKELSELYSQAIQLSPVWKELFGDVSDYSYRMLQNLVSKAKELLGTATEVLDKDGRSTGMFEMKGEDGENFTVTAEEYTRMLKAIAKKSDEISQRNPFRSFTNAWNDFINADGGDNKEKALVKLSKSASALSDITSGIASSFSDMFDALGNEELSETFDLIGDITGALGGIAEGFAQGGTAGGVVASLLAIPKVIGSIARSHDRRLDRRIQKSALEVKKLQNAYENVNKEVERQLGTMTRGQVDKQINSIKSQIEETQYMMEQERKKKKSDAGKIEDYKQEIKDLNDQLAYFYEDLASGLYGIDIKGWADQLSTSIVDAWRKGGDAAKAYEETANDILAGVANKMLAEAVFQPVFQNLRDKLPELMKSGSLSDEGMAELASSMIEAGGNYSKAIDFLEELNEKVKEGSDGRLDLKLEDELESNLGKGIQSLTEDTAQLLASYLNAIRQDVSVSREMKSKILDIIENSVSPSISDALVELKKISVNTLRSANGVESINDKLDSVISGTKSFHTE